MFIEVIDEKNLNKIFIHIWKNYLDVFEKIMQIFFKEPFRIK